jgi:hypothetical protein
MGCACSVLSKPAERCAAAGQGDPESTSSDGEQPRTECATRSTRRRKARAAIPAVRGDQTPDARGAVDIWLTASTATVTRPVAILHRHRHGDAPEHCELALRGGEFARRSLLFGPPRVGGAKRDAAAAAALAAALASGGGYRGPAVDYAGDYCFLLDSAAGVPQPVRVPAGAFDLRAALPGGDALSPFFRWHVPFSANAETRSCASLAYTVSAAIQTGRSAGIDFHRSNRDRNVLVVKPAGIFFACAVGDAAAVREQLALDRAVASAPNGMGHTPLLVAARSNFTAVLIALIEDGAAAVDDTDARGRTALHEAASLGHVAAVEVLLAHGADAAVVSCCRRTAMDVATEAVRLILHRHRHGSAPEHCELRRTARMPTVRPPLAQWCMPAAPELAVVGFALGGLPPVAISYAGVVIGLRVPRAVPWTEDSAGHAAWPTRDWHGTTQAALPSIMRDGLVPAGGAVAPGGTTVEVRPGHIPLGRTVDGVLDYPAAIFLPPDVQFSAMSAYAERVAVHGADLCCLVEVAVRDGGFTAHPSTTRMFVPRRTAPSAAEHRVANAADAVVVGAVLLRKRFLDTTDLDFDGLQAVIATPRAPVTPALRDPRAP